MALILWTLVRSRHSELSLSRLLHSRFSGSASFSSFLGASFSPAFHRTISVHSQKPNWALSFFPLHRFYSHTICESFVFPEPETLTRDPIVPGLIDLIRKVAQLDSETEAMASLDESCFELNRDVLYSLIWQLRNEWRLAFLVFRWGEKCDCRDRKTFDFMVWVMADNQKFNTSWCLIRDMHRCSMDTRKAMFIMIDRYAASDNPSKAIETFQIMDKFRLTPDEEAFHELLCALCRHGNIEEAEEFMLANRKLFPLDVKGFNIILNGWCNIWVDVLEAKRIWREMGNYCITADGDSYTHMISCFSKAGNLFDSLRLYDEMKKRGWVLGIGVYNSLVYVMTRENCLDQALKLLEKMKGIEMKPNTDTYNSMIRPLCEGKKLDEARNVLATMVGEKLSPTVDTFHAFLEAVGSDQTLEVLNRMKLAGLGPKDDTFHLLIKKFVKLKEPENALMVWAEMERFEVVADSALYLELVQGLVACGWLQKARESHAEMISKGFLGDPKIQKLLDSVQGKENKKQIKVGRKINLRKASRRRPNKAPQRSMKKNNRQESDLS